MTPQELKNSILQLAIQGKLTEQRPEEGTAEELYQKIQKYHKGLKPCKDELNFSAMDFELPESWKMVELNQLYNFIDYRGKTPIKSAGGVFLITASNIRKGYMDYTRKEYISSEEYEARKSRGITRKGDLLFTTEAPMGNAAICDLNECSCGQRIITFQEYEENTANPKLFMYFILSPRFQKHLLDNCTGTTAKGIKADKLKHLILPLPPLAEQKRIVAKIEELLPYIDRYEQAWNKLEQFNSRFPEDMKKSLLQYAIQGKLVEQRPEEGTGEELFTKIQEEKQRLIGGKKIKKEKPLPPITDDEKPFDIPESWKWVRHNELFEIIGGSQPPKSKFSDIKLDGYVRLYQIRDYGNKPVPVYIPKQLASKFSVDGDILLARYGASLGKVFWAKTGAYNVAMAKVKFLSEKNYILKAYVYYYYLAPLYQKLVRNNSRSAQAGFNKDDLDDLLFPLPPLAEQKRIVEKLEQLLPLCERLT